MVNRISLSSGK